MVFSYEDKLKASEVYEGDRVTMRIRPHDYDKYGGFIVGEVVKAPGKHTPSRGALEDGMRPMTDFVVEADPSLPGQDGQKWNWNVDNGYVIGPVDREIGRSDIGKFRGFWPAEEGEAFIEKHGKRII